MRRLVRSILRRLLRARARELGPEDLRRRAMVFSPHFDDETLGCGGTILRKVQSGAEVTIVFMTDGSQSHREFMSEDELRRLRSGEGRAAARALGVADERIICLSFPETRLSEHRPEAEQRVLELLREHQPEDVFVPYRGDPPADHVVTGDVVMRAAARQGRPLTVYEYPIWFWRHWPWTPEPQRGRSLWRRRLRRNAAALLRLFWRFRFRVTIRDVLEGKRMALEQHRSQMMRLNADPSWPVLADVADGEFLTCFLQDQEVFARRVLKGAGPKAAA